MVSSTKSNSQTSLDVKLEDWIAKTLKLLKLDYEEELEQNRFVVNFYIIYY